MQEEVQMIVFKLCEEEYGIEIHRVREIGPYKVPTKVPNMPDFIEGVINLRGEIVPVVNLKKKFNLAAAYDGDKIRIIVTNFQDKQIGFLVDEASEVLTVRSELIDTNMNLLLGTKGKYIKGVGKVDNRMIILLNIGEVLAEVC